MRDGTSCASRTRHQRRRKCRPRAIFGMVLVLMVGLLTIIVATLNRPISENPDTPSDLYEQKPSVEQQKPPDESGIKSAVDKTTWNMLLVNPWHPLPEDYEITLTRLQNGLSVDERCYPDLQDMMDDCRAAGLQPVICSAYRTQEYQERLFNNQMNKLIAQGYSEENARTEAGKVVAVPGTSEHQLGLALDIVDIENQILDESQESTAVQKWLMENSWKYGFILRYPNDKSDITGIIYEPWHYRYVGKEAAKEIYDLDVCLEEYLS